MIAARREFYDIARVYTLYGYSESKLSQLPPPPFAARPAHLNTQRKGGKCTNPDFPTGDGVHILENSIFNRTQSKETEATFIKF